MTSVAILSTTENQLGNSVGSANRTNVSYHVMLMNSGPICKQTESKLLEINIYPLILTFVYMTVGLIGNSFAIYIYGFRWKKTKTRLFVLFLAMMDMVNCAFNMPVEAAILMKPASFDNDILCKISRCVTFLVNNTSTLTLIGIAVDRFLLVYRPLKNLTLSHQYVKIVCAVSLLLGAALAWPAAIYYGTYSFNITLPNNIKFGGTSTFTCKTCLISDAYLHSVAWQLGFPITLLSLLIVIFVILSVLYILIGRKIYMATRSKQQSSPTIAMMVQSFVGKKPKGKSYQKKFNESEISEPEISPTTKICVRNSDETKLVPDSGNRQEISTSAVNGKGSKTPNTSKRLLSRSSFRESIINRGDESGRPLSRRFSKVFNNATRKNTIMMRMVTIAFMVSFTPFLVLVIIRVCYPKVLDFRNLNYSSKIAYSVFLRSYFLNSVVNPFIYGFMNKQFRVMVKLTLRKIFCLNKICKRG
ncbi:hypothetical protein CHS0354_035577 [Potamilus streckersoni]|uniref:G-protein coupled receptors family 1 profile domain-containing protein n=1 Tax=Potamilus streckersoni TaxID=2493646 RepID=A0AAE0RSX4_9BIVA|nr:hypothetical protein CHS0354_035577 [Potamilus streckersoni]